MIYEKEQIVYSRQKRPGKNSILADCQGKRMHNPNQKKNPLIHVMVGSAVTLALFVFFFVYRVFHHGDGFTLPNAFLLYSLAPLGVSFITGGYLKTLQYDKVKVEIGDPEESKSGSDPVKDPESAEKKTTLDVCQSDPFHLDGADLPHEGLPKEQQQPLSIQRFIWSGSIEERSRFNVLGVVKPGDEVYVIAVPVQEKPSIEGENSPRILQKGRVVRTGAKR